MLDDVPGFGFQVRAGMRVGVLGIGMDLDGKVFAGVEELDEDGKLPVAAGRSSGTSPCRSRPIPRRGRAASARRAGRWRLRR